MYRSYKLVIFIKKPKVAQNLQINFSNPPFRMSSNRFSTYQANGYFDEMCGLGSSPLTHYGEISSRFSDLQSGEIEAKQRQAAASFLEHGVTFTVYGDDEGTERIFPFDLIPRIIPLCEWQVVEQGLSQRIVCLLYTSPSPRD